MNERTQNEINPPRKRKTMDTFSMRIIIDLLVTNWYWYLGCMVVFGVCMGFYVKTLSYTYVRTITVQMGAGSSDKGAGEASVEGYMARRNDTVEER